jgi:alkylhydroperoxidase/carboxymuconolactone decarboxylase family protein YurZ
MPQNADLDAAWAYARRYYRDPEVEDSFRLLARYSPTTFRGYMALREGVFPAEEDAPTALSSHVKELVILAVEIGALMSPPPTYHAKKAIDAGATVDQVAEVVALCVMLRGMISYQQSGRYVLEAAHEHATKGSS